jgi:cytochrome c-type biogenesis protein
VLPLVPPYLVYLAGTSLERLADAEPAAAVKRDTVVASLLFVGGFSTVFVALGAAASSLGQGLRSLQALLMTELDRLKAATGLPIPNSVDPLAMVAGIAIIVMGLHFLGLTRIPLLMREKRAAMAKPVGLWGAYAMGLAFAFGWTPCIGPILAAILAVAGAEATVAKGAGLLAVYSLGLGIPFVVAAFAIEPFAAFLARFRSHLGLVEKAMGSLLVLTGVAFLTGWITGIGSWLLETFPGLANLAL